MTNSAGKSAQQRLDEVLRPAQIDAFSVDDFVEQLGRELPEDPDALELALLGTVAAVNKFASRVMAIRLDYLLADVPAVERPFRKYLAARVLDYVRDVEPLRARVASVLQRAEPQRAAALADAVVEAAGSVIELHGRLHAGVLSFVPPEEPDEPEQPAREPTRAELIELD